MLEGVVLWLVGQSLGLDISPFEGLFVLVLCGFFVMIPLSRPATSGPSTRAS